MLEITYYRPETHSLSYCLHTTISVRTSSRLKQKLDWFSRAWDALDVFLRLASAGSSRARIYFFPRLEPVVGFPALGVNLTLLFWVLIGSLWCLWLAKSDYFEKTKLHQARTLVCPWAVSCLSSISCVAFLYLESWYFLSGRRTAHSSYQAKGGRNEKTSRHREKTSPQDTKGRNQEQDTTISKITKDREESVRGYWTRNDERGNLESFFLLPLV